MAEVIENKVSKSGLITIDLEERMPNWDIVSFDMADVLWEGLALKEKDFRSFIKENDWSAYTGKEVFIFNSAEAIIPTWAYMLISTALSPFANNVVVGSERDLQMLLWRAFIQTMGLEEFKDQRVILKGCSKAIIPESIYLELTTKLTPVVKTLMYGEPCSTVPIFKNK